MAVLQAWPGRGFWQGTVHGQPGTLAGMTQSMAPTPQPHVLSAWITAFTAFDEAHGFAVNLFAVAVLAVIGAVFLTGQPRLIRPAVIAFGVLCLADWVLIEDTGMFGGLGTDPNSMIPMALLAAAGYLALARAPAPAAAPASARGACHDLAGPAPGRGCSPGAGIGEHPVGRVRRRDRHHHPRRGADGRRPGQSLWPTPSWRRPSTVPATR